MSSSIDNRIVNMQFNNGQFETGVNQSIKSLDALKKGLDLSGSAKNLTELDRAASQFSLDGIATGVDTIASKFNALGVIGFTVLQNITNAAINAGSRIVRALALDPIFQGYEEYELKMDSIQTIMAGTGESLEVVSGYLDELNRYADRTIYSFSDMTTNIGKFTNAGVKLKDAVGAIQGISNAAALSGANANEASRAMYNFAQALSAGYVKLIDWKSIEVANMATVEFKTQLLEAAVAAGTVTKTADGMYKTVAKGTELSGTKNFNETLEQAWLTTEVLINTLNDYADETTDIGRRAFAAAQDIKTLTQLMGTLAEAAGSGWAESFEIIIGNFEEAKHLYTALGKGLGEIIDNSSDARNEMLRFWKDAGGRKDLLISIKNVFEAFGLVIAPIEKAFMRIFPAFGITGEKLVGATAALKAFTESIKIGDKTAQNIQDTFEGLFAILDIVWMVFSEVAKAVMSVAKALLPALNNVLIFTGGVGNLVTAIRDAIRESKVFTKIMENITNALIPVATGVRLFCDLIGQAFKAVQAPDLAGWEDFLFQFESRFQPLIDLGEGFKRFVEFFFDLANLFGKAMNNLAESIIQGLSTGNFDQLYDIINTGLFAMVAMGIKKFFKSLTDLTDTAGGVLGNITDIFDGVRGCLVAYQEQLKAGVLLKIAAAIGILAASLLTISLIDSEKLNASLGAITLLMVEMFAAMSVLSGLILNPKSIFAMTSLITGFLGLSVSVLILSGAMKRLGELDWAGVIKGLGGVAGMITALVVASKLLQTNTKSLIATSIGFIAFAAAIVVLTEAVKKLSGLDTDDLIKGLLGVGALLVGLSLFMRSTDLSGMGVLRATGILILAGSLVVLAEAIRKLSSLDTDELIKGLAGMGSMLLAIVGFLHLVKDPKGMIGTAMGLTILAGAVNIFALAIIKMGDMQWNELGKGLFGLAAALGIVLATVAAMPKNIFVMSLGLLDIAGALMMLVTVIKSMAALSWDEMVRALVGLVGSFTLMTGAFIALDKYASFVDSISFVTMAAGIVVLATALKLLGSMSLAQVATALLALAGTFGVLGVAMSVMTPAIPAMLGFTAAILLLGVAVAGIGAGVLALSTGLAGLAAAGTAGAVALVGIVTSLVGLIPFVAKTLAQGVVEFAKVIGMGAPIVGKAFKELFSMLIDVVLTTVPQLVTAFLTLMEDLLRALTKFTPRLVELGSQLVISLLKGLKDSAYEVVVAGVDLVLELIAGLMSKMNDIVNAAFELMIAFIDGLANAIDQNGSRVMDAMFNLIESIINLAINTLKDSIESFIQVGTDIILGLLKGLKDGAKYFLDGIGELMGSGISKAMQVLDSHSPSEIFKAIGESIPLGTALGIKQATPKVEQASEQMTKKAVAASKKAAASTAKDAEKAAKEAFQASVDWIDERKYYNELSLYEELDAWERVQARYIEGTEQRKKADREVFRVKKQIAQADIDYANNVLRVHRDATDKRIQYEEEYLAACRSINDRLARDIENLNARYAQAVDSRAQALYDSFGLFDKVDVKDDVLGETLLDNLKGQVEEFDKWTSELGALSARGVDAGLITELQKMGPKSATEVKALNSMTDTQLNEYTSLWRTKTNQARTIAVKEMEWLRIETSSQIQMANAQAARDLEEQRAIFEEKSKKLAEDTVKQITELKDNWLKTIGELRTKGEKDFKLFTDNIISIMKTPDWYGLGQDVVEGMRLGVLSKAGELARAAAKVAADALEAAKNEIGAASPAKKFIELGKWSIEGLAIGLINYGYKATDAATRVGRSMIDVVAEAVDTIMSIIDDDVDMNPVITPVLDLSNVNSGVNSMNELFNQNRSINVSNIRSRLPHLATAASKNADPNSISEETNINFVQNNYSPKALSRFEIYRQTRNQISTLKGVVGAV